MIPANPPGFLLIVWVIKTFLQNCFLSDLLDWKFVRDFVKKFSLELNFSSGFTILVV